jgi:hypothetical protein
MLAVEVDLTTGSGTITRFDLWLEGSDDGNETDAPDLLFDWSVKDSNAGTEETERVTKRNIINNKTTTTAERHSALYRHVPWTYVRARWALTGTSPSLTFSVNGDIK